MTTLFDDGPAKGQLHVERAGHAYVRIESTLDGELYYSLHCRTCDWIGPETYAPGSAEYAAGYHDGANHTNGSQT